MSLALFAEMQALKKAIFALAERIAALESKQAPVTANKTLSINKDDGRNRANSGN